MVDLVVNGDYKGQFAVASANTLTGFDLASTLNDTDTQVILFGFKYDGELQPMFPTWDGANKPSYGSENMRVVSVKPFLIDSMHYSVGIGDVSSDRDVATAPSTYTGFDKEIPVKGSVFGVDKIPTFKQTKPYPLTIASILTKTDLN